MLGAMITIACTCAHVARAAAVAEPSTPLAWEGWLQPDNDLAVTDVVSFGGLRPENGNEHTGALESCQENLRELRNGMAGKHKTARRQPPYPIARIGRPIATN